MKAHQVLTVSVLAVAMLLPASPVMAGDAGCIRWDGSLTTGYAHWDKLLASKRKSFWSDGSPKFVSVPLESSDGEWREAIYVVCPPRGYRTHH